MHPAAPEDLHGLVDAYAGTAQAVVDLTFSLSEADFERPTPCPGWTVKDQVSHVVSQEAAMLGRSDPQVEVPDYPHVRHDMARLFEQGVELRRDRPGAEVVSELQKVLAGRLGRLRDPSLTEETLVDTPRGPRTLRKALELRVSDIWCHEQDIREALGRPGDLDGGGAANALARLFAAFPRIVAKEARIEPRHAVILDITGPVVGRVGARVEEVDGAPRGIPLFTGEVGETGPSAAPDGATTIAMSTQVATRLLAGRRSPDEVHVSIAGDAAIAGRVLAALTITP